ncbi:MAG: MCE family protein [Chlorobi bacterium]|nr:MCE family protein [Chlorobiota bacterium]
MKNEVKSNVKVGVTVFAGVILFVLVIIWAKNLSFFSEQKHIVVSYSMVPGLELGDLVTVNGVRSGKVEEISQKYSHVLVTIGLDKEVKLQKDASFNLMMLDLMGGKKIEISPGVSPDEMDYNEIQQGLFSGDVSTMMVTLNSLQSDLVGIIKDVRKSLDIVSDLYNEGELKDELYDILKSTKELTNDVSALVKENDETIKSLLSRSNKLAENANNLIEENDEKISSLLEKLNETAAKSNELITSMNAFMDETKNKNNNLGKILYDEEMFKKLTETLNELNELSKIINKQMKGSGFKVDADIF